jgi:hypothetical protein
MWRFFYHYNKPKKAMSVHFRDTCYVVDNVLCERPCRTKWNKRQPHIVMQGFARDVVITEPDDDGKIVARIL